MNKKQMLGGALSLLILILGLSVGLSNTTLDKVGSETYDVDCGSPFFPVSAPSGDSSSQDWADVLGYEYQPGPLSDSPSLIKGTCEIYLEPNRSIGIVFTLIGLLGLALVTFAVRRRRRKMHSTAPVAAQQPAGTASAQQEAYWRSQGYAPAEELPGPPPGWQRVDKSDPHI